MLAFEHEIGRKNVVDDVVQIVPVNEVVSLVTGVHGDPAELVAGDVVLHVSPHRFPHHGDGVFTRQYEELPTYIYLHSLSEELTCVYS